MYPGHRDTNYRDSSALCLGEYTAEGPCVKELLAIYLVITEAELTSKLLEVLTARWLVPLAMRGLNQAPRRLVRAGSGDPRGTK